MLYKLSDQLRFAGGKVGRNVKKIVMTERLTQQLVTACQLAQLRNGIESVKT